MSIVMNDIFYDHNSISSQL